MASDDDSQDSKPISLSYDKAALEQKRAALFDRLAGLDPKAIEKGIESHERSDRAKKEAEKKRVCDCSG